jgi:thymidylate synthase (FAD)
MITEVENLNPWFIESSSKARLVSHTPSPEEMMGYVARVTSKDQSNPSVGKLLKYCAKHGHWSVFEHATMTLEVVTPLAIAIQLLRHRSFTFQQFSGRYEDQSFMREYTQDLSSFMEMFYMPEQARLQDTKNRQNSIVAEDASLTDFMWGELEFAYRACIRSYTNMLDKGIAKELARFALPEGVFSRVYVTGNCRSWIHYIAARDDKGVAQDEHCELAQCAKQVFANVFPTVHGAINWDKHLDTDLDALTKELEEARAEIKTLKFVLSSQP